MDYKEDMPKSALSGSFDEVSAEVAAESIQAPVIQDPAQRDLAAATNEIMPQPMAMPASISMEQMMAFAQVIANAMIKAREPHVTEAQKQDKEMMRRQMQTTERRKRAQRKAEQKACPHIQGCNPLSDSMSPTNATSIIPHRLDTNILVGLCTVCGRQFYPWEEDYMMWMMKKSGNKPSKAGDRWGIDENAARAAMCPA